MAASPETDKVRRGPPKGGSPYKGDRVRITVRVPKCLEKVLRAQAKRKSWTLNDLITASLEAGL